jgi:hypothetical protein
MERMILWLNGAFGSGKSKTADELHRRLPQSTIFDPEQAGYYIRNQLPVEMMKPDFQDYPMWRDINYSLLRYMASEYSGTIIVPMTVVNPHYLNEMVGRLREGNITVHHVTLCASKNVLLQRLRSRGDGAHSWAAQQIDRCIAGLSDETFREHLATDRLNLVETAEAVASMFQIRLEAR